MSSSPHRATRSLPFNAVFCVLACASLSWTSGCQVFFKPIAQGPLFDLPAIAATAPPIPVRITDQRPKWERHYYQGSSDPEEYKKAITFLAAENFRPQIMQRLETHLGVELAKKAEPPVSAEFKLQSFRVVINRKELLRAERERQKGPDPDRGVPLEDVPSEIVKLAVLGYIDLGRDVIVLTREQLFLKERILEGPPRQLPDSYGHSITCEIQGQLILHNSDGSIHQELISSNCRAYVIESEALATDLPATVEQAIQNLLAETPKTEPETPSEDLQNVGRRPRGPLTLKPAD